MITVMDREIEVLLEKKIYSDKNELLREAYRSLLRSKPHLKIEAATELYSRGEISFSKAAEIAGMNFEEFTKKATVMVDYFFYESIATCFNKGEIIRKQQLLKTIY